MCLVLSFASFLSCSFLLLFGVLLISLFHSVQAPREEEGRLRVETGVRTGDDVSVHYDPMISKLVVWGEGEFDF